MGRVLAGVVLGATVVVPSGQAQTDWERYVQVPSSENAARVQSSSYSDRASSRERLYEDLAVLEVEVRSGDIEAVRLAFRLLGESDGHVAEALCAILTRLIRSDPQVFLEELDSYLEGRSEAELRLASIVGFLGLHYVDRIRAGEYELEQRLEALEAVSAPHVSRIRADSMAALASLLEE